MKKKERKLYLKLNVRMFGEFRISNEDGMLNTESIRSEMLTRLLTYMLCHRNKRLTAQELIDVLWSENESENPLEGSWVEKGQLKTNWESFALDATTFEHKGIRYLVWAQKNPNICGNSNLYIAKMSNPWTIEGKQVMITEPEYDWEKIGFLVNEGPAVINRNGKIFISYSASATDFNYCMGVVIADENSDLLNKDSWHKSETPVFKTDEEKEIYGPGHSCFTVSEDGKTDMLVYHARNYKDIVGDPLYDPNRHTFIKKLSYDNNGNIIFS